MKKLIMLGAAGLLLAACGDDQTAEDPTVVSPENGTTEDTGTVDDTADDAANDTGGEETTEETTGDEAQNLITVSIEFDVDDDLYNVDEDAWEQRVEVEEGTTLLELMQELYDIEEEGGMITSIEGAAQDESRNAFWTFEVNDEQSSVGAGEYVLQNNDQIDWELDD
jgi:hypothetical protein